MMTYSIEQIQWEIAFPDDQRTDPGVRRSRRERQRVGIHKGVSARIVLETTLQESPHPTTVYPFTTAQAEAALRGIDQIIG